MEAKATAARGGRGGETKAKGVQPAAERGLRKIEMREELLRHFSGPVLPIASTISYRIPDMHASADHLLVLFQSRKANKDYSID